MRMPIMLLAVALFFSTAFSLDTWFSSAYDERIPFYSNSSISFLFLNSTNANFSIYCRDLMATDSLGNPVSVFTIGCYKEVFPVWVSATNGYLYIGENGDMTANDKEIFNFYTDFSTTDGLLVDSGNVFTSNVGFLGEVSSALIPGVEKTSLRVDYSMAENTAFYLLARVCNNGYALIYLKKGSRLVAVGVNSTPTDVFYESINETTVTTIPYGNCDYFSIYGIYNSSGVFLFVDKDLLLHSRDLKPDTLGLLLKGSADNTTYLLRLMIWDSPSLEYRLGEVEHRPSSYIVPLPSKRSLVKSAYVYNTEGLLQFSYYYSNLLTSNLEPQVVFGKDSFKVFGITHKINGTLVYQKSYENLYRAIYFLNTSNVLLWDIVDYMPLISSLRHTIFAVGNGTINYTLSIEDSCTFYSSSTSKEPCSSTGFYFSPEGVFDLDHIFLLNAHDVFIDTSSTEVNLKINVSPNKPFREIFWESRSLLPLPRKILLRCNFNLFRCNSSPFGNFYYSNTNLIPFIMDDRCENLRLNGEEIQNRGFDLRDGGNIFSCRGSINDEIEILLLEPGDLSDSLYGFPYPAVVEGQQGDLLMVDGNLMALEGCISCYDSYVGLTKVYLKSNSCIMAYSHLNSKKCTIPAGRYVKLNKAYYLSGFTMPINIKPSTTLQNVYVSLKNALMVLGVGSG